MDSEDAMGLLLREGSGRGGVGGIVSTGSCLTCSLSCSRFGGGGGGGGSAWFRLTWDPGVSVVAVRSTADLFLTGGRIPNL